METNIVVFGVPDAEAFCGALERAGVLMYAIGPRRVRAVTHLDVDRAGIEQAIAAARRRSHGAVSYRSVSRLEPFIKHSEW